MFEFEITIRRALRQAGYTGATPGGQPFGRAAYSGTPRIPAKRESRAEDWVPLSRGRTEESVLDTTQQAETLLSALPFAAACS